MYISYKRFKKNYNKALLALQALFVHAKIVRHILLLFFFSF